jgi:hypothetical protein
MKIVWIKAAVLSLVLSALVTLTMTIVFGGGVSYVPPVEWERVGAMTYDEATKYLAERSERLSGWEAFLGAMGNRQFWVHLITGWLILTAYGFALCAIFLWWLRRDQSPSNPGVHTDAQNTGAPVTPTR